ncbi:MAG: peptidoglycan editing factor PgeF [Desulfobacteraceae bacterium]|jgi:YfiH family protein|nr:peptidoglycan editing factor PgeF [Desulfobacteraceae bacterium]
MISATLNGVSFYQFENLANIGGIDHGIFTRNTGHSQPPFAGLNISYGIGDEEKAVARNRGLISGIMGAGEMTYLDQVHGCEIVVLGRDKKEPISQPLIADAAVTDQPNNYLVIQVADCQSVLMYEPERQVVANVHSGWRGSIGNIIGRTVEAMQQHFGCRPDGILAGIGPSLGPCCAEFVNYKTEIPREFWRYKDSGDHFDFWAISSGQLTNAGVPGKNIETSQMCTRCRTDDFFSYRAEKTTGRFAAVIGLRGMNTV